MCVVLHRHSTGQSPNVQAGVQRAQPFAGVRGVPEKLFFSFSRRMRRREKAFNLEMQGNIC